LNDNIGYAKACNQLAIYGTGDIIGLLNADVWLNTAHVDTIQQRFDNGDFHIYGPKQRDEHKKITHGGIVGTPASPRHRNWQKLDSHGELSNDIIEPVTISGSAYFIRRNTWDELTNCPTYRECYPEAEGAFLPTRHYYEETWCSYHARSHGYKIVFDGTVTIGHSFHASPIKSSTDQRYFSESRILFDDMCLYHEIES
jgi:GT2 family glycosyltransferase